MIFTTGTSFFRSGFDFFASFRKVPTEVVEIRFTSRGSWPTFILNFENKTAMKKAGFILTAILLILSTHQTTSAQWKRPAPKNQQKRPPAGTIKVTTEIPGTLFIDNDTATTMTIFHQAVITGITSSDHMLRFNSDSLNIQRKIFVKAGQTANYVIKPDSLLLKSTEQGRISYESILKTHSYYIPKTNGLYCLVTAGLSTGKGLVSFSGKIIAGYQINPLISLGAGTGYFTVHSSFDKFYFYLLASKTISESTVFSVPFVPVFMDIRFSFLKKRAVPYFALDIGCSFPLATKFDGQYNEKYSSDDGTQQYAYHVTDINPGFYLAVNPGMKYFVFEKYYLDFSLGWDISFNNFEGMIPTAEIGAKHSEPMSAVKTTSSFFIHMGFGF